MLEFGGLSGSTCGEEMVPATSAEIFISFSRQDMGKADKICEALESESIQCWMAHRDIAPGTDYLGSLLEAADRCRAVVLILSINTSSSNIYVLDRTAKRGIPIFSVLLDDATPVEFRRFRQSILVIDATARPFESHLPSLVAQLKLLLDLIRSGPSLDDSDTSLPAADLQSSGVDDEAIEIALRTVDQVFSEMNRGVRDSKARSQSGSSRSPAQFEAQTREVGIRVHSD